MHKAITTHPGVLAYDKVHNAYLRSIYTGNFNWWSNYLDIRTIQIAALYQMTGPELVAMWVNWVNEVEADNEMLNNSKMQKVRA